MPAIMFNFFFRSNKRLQQTQAQVDEVIKMISKLSCVFYTYKFRKCEFIFRSTFCQLLVFPRENGKPIFADVGKTPHEFPQTRSLSDCR